MLDRDPGPAGGPARRADSPTSGLQQAGRAETATSVMEELERLAAGLETATFTLVGRGYEPLEVQTLLRTTIDSLRRLRLPVSSDPEAEVAPRSPRLLRVEAEAEALIDAARAEAQDLLRQARLEADGLTEVATREAASLLADAQAESRAAVLQGIREASALLARAQEGVGQGRTVEGGATNGGTASV